MRKTVYFIMGVSGTGKTTIGQAWAKILDIPFYDGDDYHPTTNVEKMTSGKPLNDSDRQEWLLALNNLALMQRDGAVIACSALKQKYRETLKMRMEGQVMFIFLQASFKTIKSRLQHRKGHFMPLSLLESQFATLEPPTAPEAITVSVEDDVETVLTQLSQQLKTLD
ncbi:Gluconokinase [Croceitalea dokdonensis DOKDO 023]|uniref:Gluconokinase n=1 Tax=Croceitalea dokdonensis DOKDO 023 TaxID=1300341 RepID=A0A0P7B4K9_9FLAO|nr:gluconokinase [Croceitalea dokdonensis]KPM33667.1 Gluconokinase [Croceitalea dokdonensis DOKDO 023]